MTSRRIRGPPLDLALLGRSLPTERAWLFKLGAPGAERHSTFAVGAASLPTTSKNLDSYPIALAPRTRYNGSAGRRAKPPAHPFLFSVSGDRSWIRCLDGRGGAPWRSPPF